MKLDKIILWTLGFLIVCSMASATLDAKVYKLCESNLSINLSDGFKMVPDDNGDASDGSFTQSFTIGNSRIKGTAMLQIMDVYDEDLKLFSPEFISNTWKMGVGIAASPGAASSMLSQEDDEAYLNRFMMEEIEDYSDKSIGNWTTIDYKGNNVTVDTLSTEGSIFSVFGKTADICHWNIGGDRYAGLLSFFDRDTTQQIIGTLVVG